MTWPLAPRDTAGDRDRLQHPAVVGDQEERARTGLEGAFELLDRGQVEMVGRQSVLGQQCPDVRWEQARDLRRERLQQRTSPSNRLRAWSTSPTLMPLLQVAAASAEQLVQVFHGVREFGRSSSLNSG